MNKRDKIRYDIQPDGTVVISRADKTKSDSILGEFLNFIARDIQKNPQHIQAISTDLLNRVQSLVAGVDVDIDAPLSHEDE